MFATELSYINNFSPNHPIVQGRLISIFVSLGSYTFFSILSIIICSCICKKSKQCNFSSCILLTLLICVDYFSAFTITWILVSLYATLLNSLAYPIYVIILFTLHVTIVIVTIIIFAVFVPRVISWWNKCTNAFLRSVFIKFCCITIGFVVLTVGISAIYLAVISAYGSTIVERIFPQDGLVQALLLLPSLFVLLGAWLFQRKFLGRYSNL